jgi:hypothetical protein
MLEWNLPNWITISLMAAVVYAVLIAVLSLVATDELETE